MGLTWKKGSENQGLFAVSAPLLYQILEVSLNRKYQIRTGAFSLMLFFGLPGVFAEPQHVPSDPHENTNSHEFHRHHAALFLGITNGVLESGHDEDPRDHAEGEQRNNDFSVGVDYEYRILHNLGLGALVDYAPGDLRTTVFAAGAFIHPTGGLLVVAAPGFESHEGKRHALFRLGFGYEFDLADRFSMTPNFNIDFVNGRQIYVYGLGIGVGF